MMEFYRLIVAELDKTPDKPIKAEKLFQKYGFSTKYFIKAANYLVKRGILKQTDSVTFEPIIDVTESWAYTRDFFQNICAKLFLDKDPGALQYNAPDENGIMRRRWMAPDDIGFLVGVGMRLLIEACWKRSVLFYGVAKDSASRYLTRNFLGVSLETGFHPELKNLHIDLLPWTDRISGTAFCPQSCSILS